MTRDEVMVIVLGALSDIAPEIEIERLDQDAELRTEADLDSMDFLNFVVALHEQFTIEIPEADYSELSTLSDCATYILARIST